MGMVLVLFCIRVPARRLRSGMVEASISYRTSSGLHDTRCDRKCTSQLYLGPLNVALANWRSALGLPRLGNASVNKSIGEQWKCMNNKALHDYVQQMVNEGRGHELVNVRWELKP